MNQDVEQFTAETGITRVLLCVDPSIASMRAAKYVCQLALPGLQVRIVSVVENPRALIPAYSAGGLNVETLHNELRASAGATLVKARQIFDECGIAVEAGLTDLAQHGDDVAHALAAEAAAWDAELIVLGARQHHGLLRWVEGVVSEPVTKLAKCAVLIVPSSYEPKLNHGLKRILFAIDGSSASQRAVLTGITLANKGAHLKAIFVIDRAVPLSDVAPVHAPEEASDGEGKSAIAIANEAFASLDKGFQAETGFLPTKRSDDDIPHAIVREAGNWAADLLVMGTHGRRGFAGWFLGSVASRVARITETPLLLVRAAQESVTASRSGTISSPGSKLP